MLRKSFICLTVLVMALSTTIGSAMAEDYGSSRNKHKPGMSNNHLHGIYGRVMGGVGFAGDQAIDTNFAGIQEVEAELDPGFAIIGALGYDYGMVRAELELGYRHNTVDSHTSSVGGALANPDGDSSAFSMMINGLYDFENESPFTPYVGLGIGFANIDYDNYRAAGATAVNDDDTVFAYQAMVGFDYAFNHQISGIAEYRYFGTADPDITTTIGNNDTSSEYDNHALLVGIGLGF